MMRQGRPGNAEQRLNFADGEPAIAKESYPLLDRLAIAAIRCDGVTITIEGGGGSSDDGDAALGLRRAQSVADYFILKGIVGDRLDPVARASGAAAQSTNPASPVISFVVNP